MKKIIYLAIIMFSLTSCNHYINLGGGGCGSWAPRKFEKDRRTAKWVKSASIRNKWHKHY